VVHTYLQRQVSYPSLLKGKCDLLVLLLVIFLMSLNLLFWYFFYSIGGGVIIGVSLCSDGFFSLLPPVYLITFIGCHYFGKWKTIKFTFKIVVRLIYLPLGITDDSYQQPNFQYWHELNKRF
jgi:hypothetical protein